MNNLPFAIQAQILFYDKNFSLKEMLTAVKLLFKKNLRDAFIYENILCVYFEDETLCHIYYDSAKNLNFEVRL